MEWFSVEEQSFIVRFYRFDSHKPDDVIGTVQAAESGLQLSFTGMGGLWQTMDHLKTPLGDNRHTQAAKQHKEFAMTLNRFGLLVGHPTAQTLDDDNDPHIEVLLDVAGVQNRAAINVRSNIAPHASLYIDCASAPVGGEVKLKMPTRYLDGASVVGLTKVWESEGGMVCHVVLPTGTMASLTGIKLKSRENTLIRVEVKLPQGVHAGDVYPVFVEQRINGRTTGRVSLVARIVGTPAYIANSNPQSLEIHLPNCRWVKKMAGHHKIPYDDLQLAIQRGYNGCRFCLPEYNKG